MTKPLGEQIDVWIVNDSKYMTELLKDVISDKNIHVSFTARDGEEALRKLGIEKPDVIILDLEMPRMDGLTFIEEITKQGKLIPIIVVSSFTQDGAKIVLDALESGALDFVPISQINPDKINQIKTTLISKIQIAAKSDPSQLIPKNIEKIKSKKKTNHSSNKTSKVIVIGSSTGGPKIIETIISALPADLGAGILIVQHMPKEFTTQFANRLSKTCDLTVREARDGDLIRNGLVLVAPGNYHMLVDAHMKIKLISGPKRFGVRPAVNMTMVSASEVYGSNTIGILLTGMGHDGAFGMKTIKKRGGKTIAQDSKTAVVYGMPKAAVDLKAVDRLLPTEKIPEAILTEIEKIARN